MKKLAILLTAALISFLMIEVMDASPGQVVFSKSDYEDVLGKSILFYEAQRSGDLPATNRVPWRHDSCLTDGADLGLNLSKGYFDAGDHLKSSLSISYMTTVLSWGYLEFSGAYEDANEEDNLLDSIKWATDYLMECHYATDKFVGMVGNKTADHGYWGRPEDMTMARPAQFISSTYPGSDLAGQAAAALAAASMVFESSDPVYAATLLSHARELFRFAVKHKGLAKDRINQMLYGSGEYNRGLAWGAVWMYMATRSPYYLNKAKHIYKKHLYNQWWQAWSFDMINLEGAIELLLYEATRDPFYKTEAEQFLNYFMDPQKIAYTPDGLMFRHNWGSLRHAANIAFLAVVADSHGVLQGTALPWGKSQLDYMLGDNDNNQSYVIGFGVEFPKSEHHRAASCPTTGTCGWNEFSLSTENPQILTGALVGGPKAVTINAITTYVYSDDRSNYEGNEVALDYNAAFQGLVAGVLNSLP